MYSPRQSSPSPQTLVQGGQEFVRERGRTAAMKRGSAKRVEKNAVPRAGNGGEAAQQTIKTTHRPPMPRQRRRQPPAKATVTAIKAAIAATQELIAAIAAGVGWYSW